MMLLKLAIGAWLVVGWVAIGAGYHSDETDRTIETSRPEGRRGITHIAIIASVLVWWGILGFGDIARDVLNGAWRVVSWLFYREQSASRSETDD